VEWSELSQIAAANQFTVDNLEQRLSRLKKDPWADLPGLQQRLPR
jgi:DNA primase